MTGEQRERLHRWDQMGLVVLGLIHDFNNTGILLLDELVRLEVQLEGLRELLASAEEPVRQAASDRLTACERSAQVIGKAMQVAISQMRQAQGLVRHEPPAGPSEGTDLIDAAGRAVELLGGRARLLGQQGSGEALRVRIGAQALIRVLVNLLLNAADAFPSDAAAPRIRMQIRQEGDTAICDVADNGPGVAPEIRGRLFQPFATTRAPSGGTGLGLSISRDLVRAAGGDLDLLQTGPAGTVFRLRLPLVEPVAAGSKPRVAELVIVPLAPARPLFR